MNRRQSTGPNKHLADVAKAQKVLLQDVDEGAPCQCGECEGFRLHVWRKACCHCKCPWEMHMTAMGGKAQNKFATIHRAANGKTVRATAKAYFDDWLTSLHSHQNPMHDTSLDFCSSIETEDQKQRFDEYLKKKADEKRDNEPIQEPSDKLLEHAEKHSLSQNETSLLEPYRFCEDCSQPITGEHYFETEQAGSHVMLCGRCHAQHYLPRCFGCDELILDEEFTQAEGKDWHLGHFCCYKCDTNLGGHKYTTVQVKSSVPLLSPSKSDAPTVDQPVCLSCYNQEYANFCHTCSDKITVSDPAVEIGGVFFHKRKECFQCKACSKYLYGENGGEGVLLDNEIFCHEHAEKKIYRAVPRCRGCDEALDGPCVKAEGKVYHVRCFNCFNCTCSLVPGSSDVVKVKVRNGHLNCGKLECLAAAAHIDPNTTA